MGHVAFDLLQQTIPPRKACRLLRAEGQFRKAAVRECLHHRVCQVLELLRHMPLVGLPHPHGVQPLHIPADPPAQLVQLFAAVAVFPCLLLTLPVFGALLLHLLLQFLRVVAPQLGSDLLLLLLQFRQAALFLQLPVVFHRLLGCVHFLHSRAPYTTGSACCRLCVHDGLFHFLCRLGVLSGVLQQFLPQVVHGLAVRTHG